MAYEGFDRPEAEAGVVSDADLDRVPTVRIASGYPQRGIDREPGATVAGRPMLTAHHAAALFQTHVIAQALAPANDVGLAASEPAVAARAHPAAAADAADEPLPLLLQPASTSASAVPLPLEERDYRRRLALTCLIAGALLFFWAGLMALRDQGRMDAVVRGAVKPMAFAPGMPASGRGGSGGDLFGSADPRQPSPAEQQLAQGERLIAEGRIVAARRALAVLAAEGEARALFALAETFDPHMLKAWGVAIAADVPEARRLYAAAGVRGHLEAARRLDALP